MRSSDIAIMDSSTFRHYRTVLASSPSALLHASLNALESLQDATEHLARRGVEGSNAGQWHTAAVELERAIDAEFARIPTGEPVLAFSLPVRLPTLNPMLRTHWTRRRKEMESLAWQVVEAVPLRHRPRVPLEHIIVQVDRHTTQEPDAENLKASAKLLLDVLQPLDAKLRPYGLGFIRNDATWCVHDLAVRHVASKQRRTDVRIYAAAAVAR